jgi:hypothetical protein
MKPTPAGKEAAGSRRRFHRTITAGEQSPLQARKEESFAAESRNGARIGAIRNERKVARLVESPQRDGAGAMLANKRAGSTTTPAKYVQDAATTVVTVAEFAQSHAPAKNCADFGSSQLEQHMISPQFPNFGHATQSFHTFNEGHGVRRLNPNFEKNPERASRQTLDAWCERADQLFDDARPVSAVCRRVVARP